MKKMVSPPSRTKNPGGRGILSEGFFGGSWGRGVCVRRREAASKKGELHKFPPQSLCAGQSFCGEEVILRRGKKRGWMRVLKGLATSSRGTPSIRRLGKEDAARGGRQQWQIPAGTSPFWVGMGNPSTRGVGRGGIQRDLWGKD